MRYTKNNWWIYRKEKWKTNLVQTLLSMSAVVICRKKLFARNFHYARVIQSLTPCKIENLGDKKLKCPEWWWPPKYFTVGCAPRVCISVAWSKEVVYFLWNMAKKVWQQKWRNRKTTQQQWFWYWWHHFERTSYNHTMTKNSKRSLRWPLQFEARISLVNLWIK